MLVARACLRHLIRVVALLGLLALPGEMLLPLQTAFAGSGPLIDVPASALEPVLEGQCHANEYAGATAVQINIAPAGATFAVYLMHTPDFLYVCFDHPPAPQASNGFLALYLDRDNNGGGGDADDAVFAMPFVGGPTAGAWNAAHGTYDGADPAGWTAVVSADGSGAEFRISRQTVGGWDRTVGLALFYHWYRYTGDDYAWPANNVWANPALWANAHLSPAPVMRTCMFADVNDDCAVDDRDLQAAENAWGTAAGQPNFTPDADLDGDGLVSISDVQRVASQHGRFSMRGGEVHGYVSTHLGGPELADTRLPDMRVYLKNTATGKPGLPVTTDRHGEYFLPKQAPGTYQLCLEGTGFVSHCDDAAITIGNETYIPSSDARAVPEANAVHGMVTLADGRPCFREYEFFKTLMGAVVSLLDASGSQVVAGPVQANSGGQYVLPNIGAPGPYRLRASCGTAVAQQPVVFSNNDFGNGTPFDLMIGNAPPVITSLLARKATGEVVRSANPGETLQVMASTVDANGDGLHYQWGDINTGVLPVHDAPVISWTLSPSPALNALYVQVTDDNGGFALDRIRIPAGRSGVLFSGTAFEVTATHTITPALAGAQVSIGGITVTTDLDGHFSLIGGEAERYLLNAGKAGYGFVSQILRGGATDLRLYLSRVTRQPCDPTQLCQVADTLRGELGASLTISPSTLVDFQGNPATTTVNVDIFTYDLTQPNGAPGERRGRLADASELRLDSFAVAGVELSDASGKRYALANGRPARIRIPVDSDVVAGTLPSSVPLWRYMPDTALWQFESDATVPSSAEVKPAGTAPQGLSIVYTAEFPQPGLVAVAQGVPNTACVQVTVDESKAIYPFELRGYYIQAVGNGQYTLAWDESIAVSEKISGFFNMPPNVIATLVVRPGFNNPIAVKTFTVNTGANTGVSAPAYPYSACGGQVTIALDVPEPVYPYISKKGTGSDNDANYYYLTALGTRECPAFSGSWTSRPTLLLFKICNGFLNGNLNPVPDISAYYYNAGDLGLGREMHCKETISSVACYVTNYGSPGGPHELAFTDMFTNHTPVATVAMEYFTSKTGDYIVKFFVYNAQGNRINFAELDSDGPKYVPQVCLACHGGDFGSYQNPDKGAHFLPFDVYSFKYHPNYSLNYQMENFRKLNQRVLWTSPDASNPNNAPISYLLGGMYNGNVNMAGAVATNIYVPSAWSSAGKTDLYNNIVKPYCRTCHVALPSYVDWTQFTQFITYKGGINIDVCKRVSQGGLRLMPHAEVPFRKFWLSVTPIYAPDYLSSPTTGIDILSGCTALP